MDNPTESIPTLSIVEGPYESDSHRDRLFPFMLMRLAGEMVKHRDPKGVANGQMPELGFTGRSITEWVKLVEQKGQMQMKIEDSSVKIPGSDKRTLHFSGSLSFEIGESPKAELLMNEYRRAYTPWREAVLAHFGGLENVYLLNPNPDRFNFSERRYDGKVKLLAQVPSSYRWVYLNFLEYQTGNNMSQEAVHWVEINPVTVIRDNGGVTLNIEKWEAGDPDNTKGIITELLWASQEVMLVMEQVWGDVIGPEGLSRDIGREVGY